jgi:ParB-like chromosome segregation protein Spo0J
MERKEAMTTEQPAETGLEVRRVRLDEIHHDPANTRKHGPRNLENIVASLQEFGQVEPLVVQKGTGKVIGGNGRLTAMKSLGYTECDIVEFDGSPVQATALGITLNRSAELASWDNSALAETLRALQEEEFDLEAVGFTDDEVNELFDGPGSGLIPDDASGKEYDESVADEVKYQECPNCGHKFPK